MSITISARIQNGKIIPKDSLNIEEGDVLLRIEHISTEPAIKTKILVSEDLVKEVMESELDIFL